MAPSFSRTEFGKLWNPRISGASWELRVFRALRDFGFVLSSPFSWCQTLVNIAWGQNLLGRLILFPRKCIRWHLTFGIKNLFSEPGNPRGIDAVELQYLLHFWLASLAPKLFSPCSQRKSGETDCEAIVKLSLSASYLLVQTNLYVVV